MKVLWKILCSYKRAEEKTKMELHAAIMERNETMAAKDDVKETIPQEKQEKQQLMAMFERMVKVAAEEKQQQMAWYERMAEQDALDKKKMTVLLYGAIGVILVMFLAVVFK